MVRSDIAAVRFGRRGDLRTQVPANSYHSRYGAQTLILQFMASLLGKFEPLLRTIITLGRRALCGLIATLIVAFAAPAYGQATFFSNREAFEAAVPGRTVLDFGSVLPFSTAFIIFSLPPVLNLDGVNFQRLPFNPGGMDLSILTPSMGTPYQGWTGNPVVFQYVGVTGSSLVITLPPGTLAVGTNFYTVQTSVNAVIGQDPNVFTGNLQVTLSNGQTFIIPSTDKPNMAFMGFVSTTPITSLTIFPPLASPTALATGYVDLTNLSYSTGPPPVLSCPADTGTVGSAYSSSFPASGGAPPYTSFAITAGALPNGVNIDSFGHVAGTPTLAGGFFFSGTVTDSFGRTGTANCSITIASPPPITLSAVPVKSSNGTQILLTWNYGGPPIDGFVIQRKPPTLSSSFVPLAAQSGSVPSGPQACPQATYVAGLLAPQTRCLVDTVPEAGATYTYQILPSGGAPPPNPAPSQTTTVFQVRKTLGTGIDAAFTPAATHTVQEAAQSLNYDHFNWLSIVSHDPTCYINTPSNQLHAYNTNSPPGVGAAQLAPHLDPPLGGYTEYGFFPPNTNLGPSDGLPYFWDEQTQWALDPNLGVNPVFNLLGTAGGGSQIASDTARFKDIPFNPCLPGNGPTGSATEYWGFVTTLVGVRNPIGNIGGLIGGTQPVNFTPLASFTWNTTYNGAGGGASGVRSLNLDAPLTAGTGGVFNVVDLGTQDLPLAIRQMLTQAGGQNISSAAKIDTDPPATAAFLSGPQQGNGSYTGPVTVKLIATDIDGPSDVASTSYKLDGGAATAYSIPFVVSSPGTHTVVFSSNDQAQNAETPQPSVSFTIAGGTPLSITGPATLAPGTLGTLYVPAQFTATGGSGTGYTWTQTGPLPMGMNFSASGLLSGTPGPGTQGSYNPQFKVTDSASNSATVTLALTINSPISPAPSITSMSPNPVLAAVGVQTIFISGQNFQNGVGLKVHLSNGAFQTDLTGAQVAFLSATQLSIQADVGTVSANWTATAINPDNQSSNVFAFSVQAAQVTSYALPQFTFGGAWYTALYFANTSNVVAHIQVNFYSNSGVPLTVPLLGIGSVSSQAIDLSPRSTVILEVPTSGGANQEGWAEATLPTGVTGYAVFRQTIAGRPDQEAVVPLTPENSQTADLTYDDILFTTAVGFVNPTNAAETVTISAFDANGAPIGSTQVVINPRSKVSNTFKAIAGLGGIAGNRGRAVFSVPSGAVSVLGLRFGGSAFTSIQVFHRPAVAETRTISFALPQFVFGGAWYTALYFSNTTNAPLSVPVSFVGDNGAPLGTPLLGLGGVSSVTLILAPGSTSVLEAPTDAGSTTDGWVNATLPPGVTGYAVFRQTVAGRPDQEAVVRLTTEASQAADLVYDDTLFTTTVALLNPSDQQATVTITAFSASGSQIGTAQVVLPSHSKVAPTLKNMPGLSGISGNRGWVSFSVSNGDLSILGLRFGGSAFTSIPVAAR
jgi:hypothetical protein